MNLAGKSLAWYEYRTPYFPGKWRTLRWMSSQFHWYTAGVHRATREGLRWELDTRCFIQRSLYYLGCYADERWEVQFLKQVLQPRWCVIDAGANFGYYALLAAKHVGPSGAVYAFEPSTPVFEQLIKNLELNEMPWVSPIKFALGETENAGHMPIPERWNQQLQGISAQEDRETEQVQITTLDRFATRVQCSRIHLIKADVEGYEVHLLKGASGVLREYQPLLMLELNPLCLARYGFTPIDLLSLVESYSYEVFRPYRRSLRKLTAPPRLGQHVNIIAIPRHHFLLSH